MKPQSAKSKGRRLQQQVAEDIKQAFPQLSGNDVRSISMGANGEDILLSPKGEMLFPYSVECKNCERLNVWNAIDQCKKNAGSKTELVIVKKNHTPSYAVLPWTMFLSLHVRATENNQDSDKPAEQVPPSINNQEQKIARVQPLLDEALKILSE